MKNILIIGFLLFCVGLTAQVRTITKQMEQGATYYLYTGVANDTLTSPAQDTIDLVIEYRADNWVKKLTIKSRFDMRSTADTTVAISVFGKEFSDDAAYVEVIASTLSSAVTANNVVSILSSDYTETTAAAVDLISQITSSNTDTVTVAARTVTPFDKSYRFYRIRYIIKGNDSVGTGIKLDQFEIKMYVD